MAFHSYQLSPAQPHSHSCWKKEGEEGGEGKWGSGVKGEGKGGKKGGRGKGSRRGREFKGMRSHAPHIHVPD